MWFSPVTPTEQAGREELERCLERRELVRDVGRLRRFFFKPRAALHELRLSPEADPSMLYRWNSAPAHSPESVKANAYDRAIGTLLLWEAMRSG
ncbi:MAG: hypothetical protein M3P49_10660 [Actinomycetota bacterium]|nr:hypothetical protein [Actinomycetota bacterium]